MSTYDFVINRRHNRTVDQTLTQFNQLSRTHNIESNPPSIPLSKLHTEKVYSIQKTYLI